MALHSPRQSPEQLPRMVLLPRAWRKGDGTCESDAEIWPTLDELESVVEAIGVAVNMNPPEVRRNDFPQHLQKMAPVAYDNYFHSWMPHMLVALPRHNVRHESLELDERNSFAP